jgi:hypothetical protein
MLRFTFEIIDGDNAGEISGFVRGHMGIAGPGGEVTSKGKRPDQSMMVFPSVVVLLDGIRRFLSDKKATHYHFVATDSSFQFTVQKDVGERISVSANGTVLDSLQPSQLVGAMWSGLLRFLASNAPRLKPDDAVAGDLNSSEREFACTFGLEL